MSRDGNGTYTNPYPDFVSGTVISSTEVDANNADIATALTQSIAVDGQSTITADLPMDGNKHTGVDAAAGQAARNEYPAAAVVQDGDLTELGSVAGTADVITAATTPAITAYAQGQRFSFVVGSTNTTAVTINVSSVGAKAIQKLGAALVAGDLTANDVALIEYDGTQFQLLSPARTPVLTAGGIATAAIADNAVTLAKLAGMTADRLLGSDGSGDPSEVTLSGLTLSAAALSVDAATTTAAGKVEKATQAEVEGETADKYADTASLKYHPDVAKALVVFDGAAVDGVADLTGVDSSYNITSVVDNGTGDYTINFDDDFSAATYCVQATGRFTGTTTGVMVGIHNSTNPTTGAVRILCLTDGGSAVDPDIVCVAVFGDF